MPTSFIAELKSKLPEHDWARVIHALRHERLVWQALQNETFAVKALSHAGSNPLSWSPASLAFLEMEEPELYEILKKYPDEIIEERFLAKAASVFGSIASGEENNPNDINLSNAGWISLALRERWKIADDISSIWTDISATPKQLQATTAACLLGILKQPKFLLSALLSPEVDHSFRELGVHAILANPLSLEDKSKTILDLFTCLSPQQRLPLLKEIEQDQPSLGKTVAIKLLERNTESLTGQSNQLEEVQRLLEQSELLQISGEYNKAMPVLEKAWKSSMRIQAELTAQLAQAAAKGNDQETAIQAIEQISQFDTQLLENEPNVMLAKIHTGQLEAPPASGTGKGEELIAPVSPASLLATAKLAIQEKDLKKAQLIAQQALEVTLHLNRAKSTQIDNSSKFSKITPEFLQSLSETLHELSLPIEACRAAELAMDILPNDPHTLWLISKAQIAIGEKAQALEYAHTATALAPDAAKYRRNLIDILLTSEKWEEAKEEIEALIAKLPTPLPKDFHILAECCLKANQPKQAAQACQKALHLDSKDGSAHALLGDAFTALGDTKSAFHHYNQAIISSPGIPSPWLAIANHHLDKGEVDKAKERLLAGIQSLPDNPALLLTLGKVYIQEKNLTNAMSELQKAMQFISQTPDPILEQEIAFELGKAQIELGYLEEAGKLLEDAHQNNPTNGKLAHLYGKTLLMKKDFGPAVSALAIAMQNPEASAEVYIDYSLAHLEIGNHPEEAKRAIQVGLLKAPNNPKGLALLAEATAQCGDHKEAIPIYEQSLRSDLTNDPMWHTRLSKGLAKTAFSINQPEIAVATLKDAFRQSPEDTSLMKALCEAYIMAHLDQEAMSLLTELFKDGKNDLDTLLWVSDQALELKKPDISIEALNKALQLAPDKAEIVVRLGYIQLENDEQEKARKTFSKLFATDKVKTGDLRLAAQALIGLGDVSSSIPYLERALEINNYQSKDLLGELTNIQYQNGNYKEALNSLEKHIKLAKNEANLWAKKADILEKLGKREESLECILEAISLSPLNGSLHAKASKLLRVNDMAGSLSHAEKAYSANPDDLKIRFQAAEVNFSALQTNRAAEIVKSVKGEKPKTLSWAFLESELALEEGLWKQVEGILEKIKAQAEGHPHYLALEARILNNKKQTQAAKDKLEKALMNLGAFDLNELDTFVESKIRLAVAETAICLGLWDIAMYLIRQTIQKTPNEPRPYLMLAKAYTLKAESHHDHMAVNAVSHSPGRAAVSETSAQSFGELIDKAYQYAPTKAARDEINRWQVRGQLVFKGSTSKKEWTPTKPEEAAALVSSYRRMSKVVDVNAVKQFGDHHEVKFQLALALAKNEPGKAFKLVKSAVKNQTENPIYLALLAYLSKENGATNLGLESINQALTLQADEPRWHALAARFQKAKGHTSAVIAHLEQASQLEPEHAPHFYQLGQAYIEDGSPGNAIRALEKAVGLLPTEEKYWSKLCKAHMLVNDLEQAGICADQVIKLNPRRAQPILTRAEIAFEAEDKGKAEQLIELSMQKGIENPTELKILSDLLVKLDKADEAINILEDMIDRAVDPLPLLLERAQLVKVTKGAKSKLDTLTALAKDFPDEPSVLGSLVTAYIENNQPDEAIRAAQHAIKLADAEMDKAKVAKIHYQLGTLLRQSGQLDNAIHHLSESAKLAPQFADTYLELGEAHHQRRQYEEALVYYQQALSVAPNDYRGYKAAGMLQKECKDYIAAEAMLRRASTLAPKDVDIQRQLGAVIALALVHKPKETQVSP